MGEWDGVEHIYIPQCAVCKHCDGLGCKAFQTKERDPKYYDSRNGNFSKCEYFYMNEEAPHAEKFFRLSKSYKWKK